MIFSLRQPLDQRCPSSSTLKNLCHHQLQPPNSLLQCFWILLFLQNKPWTIGSRRILFWKHATFRVFHTDQQNAAHPTTINFLSLLANWCIQGPQRCCVLHASCLRGEVKSAHNHIPSKFSQWAWKEQMFHTFSPHTQHANIWTLPSHMQIFEPFHPLWASCLWLGYCS